MKKATPHEQNIENIRLCARIQAGDKAAEEEIIIANEGFIITITQNTGGPQSHWTEDQRNEARLGLLLAARHYDPRRGNHFLTEAGIWASKLMKRSYVDTGFMVRVPEHAFWGKKIRTTWQSIDQLGELIDNADPNEADERLDTSILTAKLKKAIRELDSTTQRIIDLRFGLTTGQPATWTAIAQMVGKSSTTARREYSRAMAAIQQTMNSPHPHSQEIPHAPQRRIAAG